MAGNYPDVSSWRMAWDVDGSQAILYRSDSTSLSQLSPAQIVGLNSEDGGATLSFSQDSVEYRVTVIFPELRDLDGYILNTWGGAGLGSGPALGPVRVSPDTTNGEDGTWVTLQARINDDTEAAGILNNRTGTTFKELARRMVGWNTALGIKGVSFGTRGSNWDSAGIRNIHLFGEPSPDENPQRLEIWHPTLDQRLGPADLDWGDVPRNTTEIREFRIKNMHPTLTANSVRAAMSILTDTSPSVVGQQAISKDGGATWGAQQTLTSPLGPEAISPVLQLRRQTPANAVLSLWWYRLFADCSSWT